jgi:hypothetical protein
MICDNHLPQIHEFSEFFRIKDCSTWIWVLLLNEEEKFSFFHWKYYLMQQRKFPLLDQEGWISMRNEWKAGVVEIQAYLSFPHSGN